MTTTLAPFADSGTAWERALYAFLAEKLQRSGSRRTVEGYSRMLQHFFVCLGKQPHEVNSRDVFAYAHGPGLSGRQPSAITIGARIACLSSFYRFLIRMELVQANPCDKLERPRMSPSPPRGMSGDQVQQLLAVVPDTPVGLRDRAIILTLVLTGRRRAEVLNMKAGDLSLEGDRAYYSYRGKGGKKGRRELPRPALEAIRTALVAFGKDLSTMAPESPLWPSRSQNSAGLTSGTFYGNLQRYFRRAGIRPAGVHIFRHTAAKLRRDAGETVEEVSSFLDHSSLAVTSVYLRRLEGDRDRSWEKVAEAIGV
ncbi:MAG: tyrosine-type recombinase/integrase [Chloroflexi bacterium]|nr:tyrosine-type recombinase/integrase [Chloroflexota bacterium]